MFVVSSSRRSDILKLSSKPVNITQKKDSLQTLWDLGENVQVYRSSIESLKVIVILSMFGFYAWILDSSNRRYDIH